MAARPVAGLKCMNLYRVWQNKLKQSTSLLAVLLLAICLAAVIYTALQAQRRVLLVATADDFENIDPSQSTSLNCSRSLYSVYETLVRPGTRPGEIAPWLAESWQSDAQQRIWTFYLRKGVYFHDGTECNAQTVAEALRRCCGSEGIQSGFFPQHRALLGERGRSLLQKAEAVDSFAVRIELRKPVADFLEIMAQPAMAVTIVRMSKYDGRLALWGTGPYRIEERRPRQRLVLRRFADYWRIRPTWDKIIFWHVDSAGWRRRLLCRGDVDVAFTVGVRELDELKKQNRIKLLLHPGKAYWSLMPNCSSIPFKDIRCRLGLQYAFDKAGLADFYLREYGSAAEAGMPAGSWAYPKDLSIYAYDPKKARSWLTKVYGKGMYQNLDRVELLYDKLSPLDDDTALIAVSLTQAMNKAGLNAYPCGVEHSEYLRRLATGAFQMALVLNERRLSDPDVELSLQWSESGGINGLVNVSNYSSERLTQAINEARSVPTREGRRSAYFRAMRLLHEGAAEVPLAWSAVVSAYRGNISGIGMNRLNMVDFSEAAFRL